MCVDGFLDELPSSKVGIRFSERNPIMAGDIFENFCCGFSVNLEFEKEWDIGFSRFGGQVFCLEFEFTRGF